MSCSRVTLAAAALVLVASQALEAAQHSPAADRDAAALLEVIVQDAWALDVRIGRVAVESRVLVFRETGDVCERIFDDTGVHDASGKWTLERSNGSLVLVLTGEHLRDRGRFEVARLAKEDAIELRSLKSQRALRFVRRKGVFVPRTGAEAMGAEVLIARQRTPPTGDGGPSHWECWLRDPDGSTVVISSPCGTAGNG